MHPTIRASLPRYFRQLAGLAALWAPLVAATEHNASDVLVLVAVWALIVPYLVWTVTMPTREERLSLPADNAGL